MRKSCDDLQVANDVEELMFRERLKKKKQRKLELREGWSKREEENPRKTKQ